MDSRYGYNEVVKWSQLLSTKRVKGLWGGEYLPNSLAILAQSLTGLRAHGVLYACSQIAG